MHEFIVSTAPFLMPSFYIQLAEFLSNGRGFSLFHALFPALFLTLFHAYLPGFLLPCVPVYFPACLFPCLATYFLLTCSLLSAALLNNRRMHKQPEANADSPANDCPRYDRNPPGDAGKKRSSKQSSRYATQYWSDNDTRGII